LVHCHRNLLDGRQGLSADMAIQFERAFGLKAETLMRTQAAHELAEARAKPTSRLRARHALGMSA